MVDVAHSVFNAVTGVSEEEEAREIRAFRSVQDWRAILEDFGFTVSRRERMEKGGGTGGERGGRDWRGEEGQERGEEGEGSGG
jgi:hypothetical protein